MLKEAVEKSSKLSNIESELRIEIEKALTEADKLIKVDEKNYDIDKITDCNDNIKFLLGEINAELDKQEFKGKKA